MSQIPSTACCNTPIPPKANFSEKGKYTTVSGLKTYATGPATATKGILVIYDVFGFFPQTLQGADILATNDKERQRRVYMPDFFEGEPADITWYPADTQEKGELLGNFFQTKADLPEALSKVNKVMKELKSLNPQITDWAVVGYCWGGKVANLVSQSESQFKAAAACHPAMVDPNDAPNVAIPICVILSQDEDEAEVRQYAAKLTVSNHVEWYKDQIHGFMAARGNLNDDHVKAGYVKAYDSLLSFFRTHL